MRVILLLWLAWFVLMGAPAAAQAPEQPISVMEELVVRGEVEGPRVWRVYNGENELVILGALSPLPKGVTWRSQSVETLIGDADLVMPDTIAIAFPELGPIKTVGLLLELRKQSRNEEKAKLREVLPPDLYARYAALRAKYGKGDNTWEKLRPLAAGGQLVQEAYEDSGVRTFGLSNEVRKIAQKKKRPWEQTRVEFRGDVKAAIREADANSAETELACFREMLDGVERDLPLLRQRADAWARGEVARLRSLPRPARQASCLAVLQGSKEFADLIDQGRAKLVQRLDEALAKNRSTFLVADIDSLLHGNLLKDLAAKGYRIEGP